MVWHHDAPCLVAAELQVDQRTADTQDHPRDMPGVCEEGVGGVNHERTHVDLFTNGVRTIAIQAMIQSEETP